MSVLAWVDLETTGLDPEEDQILEVAMVLTTEALEILSSSWFVINPWPEGNASRALSRIDPYVRNMHTENGLIDEALNDGIPLATAEARLVDAATGRGVMTLAGSSVHFDRSFLRLDMPELLNRMGHRHVDVSAVREMAKMWSPGLMETFHGWLDANGKDSSGSTHRAMSDITRSIDLARFFRETTFVSAF